MNDKSGAPRRQRRRATAAQGAPPAAGSPAAQKPTGQQQISQPQAERVAPPADQGSPSARSTDGQQRRGRHKSPAPERNTAGAAERRVRGDAERSVRDLVGAGPSQVGVSAALRARDVNRPTEQDLAEAAETVVIVRRNWQPPTKR